MTISSRTIALEEHFSLPYFLRSGASASTQERLVDLGEHRLRELDEAHIDVQVVSHAPPGPQNLEPLEAIRLSRVVNETLHQATLKYPDRLAGFATLPLSAPEEAAKELERTVKQFAFKGALLHGRGAGVPLDDRRFRSVFAAAAELDVPIYIHPDAPPPPIADVYYKSYPELLTAGWAYTVETATQALRLILSGIFDEYTHLKIILGHLGEALPFVLVRSDAAMTPKIKLKKSVRDYFHEHFWITTSGNFSNPALICSILEIGADRIMFSVDWPFASNIEAIRFLERAPISDADKHKILGANAEGLLKL